MIRNGWLPLALVAIGAFGVSYAGAAQERVSLDKEIERLRNEVAELKKKSGRGEDLTGLKTEVAALRDLTNQSVAYLNAQAAQAGELAAMLADSEKKGFTFGINPDSRVALLKGLNEFCTSLRRNPPGHVADANSPEPTEGR